MNQPRVTPEQAERIYNAARLRFTSDPTVENEEELDYWRLVLSAHDSDAIAARNAFAKDKLR